MTDRLPFGRLTHKLGFQTAFILAVVLLPLTAISIARSAALVREARARSEAALVGATLHAASRELQLIQEARGTAAAIAASLPSVVDDTAACTTMLRDIADASSYYTLVAFVPSDGLMRCSSSGREFDFSGNPLSREILERGEPSIMVNQDGPVSGKSILGITHPVVDGAGAQIGYVAISVPHSALSVPEGGEGETGRPLEIVTFDSDGNILTASGWAGGYEDALPADRSLRALAGNEPVAFTANAANGMPRVFSVVPLVAGEFYAMGTWPAEGTASLPDSMTAVPFLLPVMIWFASVVAAWFAVERLVIRHIRKLRKSLISFAGGHRVVGDIDVSGAAVEIREMGDAYERMTETILHDEAELEDMVHQKEVLLREVHHRVKNNLQLIASIMNMQMRRTRSEEARATLKGLQDRVMSLATIHRELYQTAGLSDVHSAELLSSIVRQIASMSDRPDRRFSVHTDIDDIRMTPDQAVPLALLVAEAVTNAIKYASGPQGQAAGLWVLLKRVSDTRASVTIRNSLASPAEAAPGDDLHAVSDPASPGGLGTQLVSAFAMQLGGTIHRTTVHGFYDLTVEFELRPLTDAEARNAAGKAEVEPVG